VVRLSEEKGVLEGMYGPKERVTDYKVHEVFTYLALQKDKARYLTKLQDIKLKKAKR